mmetsp:Transcript_15631/g.47253  ORF Transcript_15631/g.47253 Transcript_15631/m.47253 type:complete len:254 (+) Transcript_15631:128-889(+)|eukprot:CAMPEP_0198669382 /NCGR_PEP_ID=MMETSP1467-20131203/75934_1 /TAXON_ID=1462469 /ORGANISM="unid. sp., Strain CCMP2135" /LENGTH=253 /DNA_ID=CAMNT_0044406129 /DNA_START=66 /DNA_END=827 /DNA_ORIENTATION=+
MRFPQISLLFAAAQALAVPRASRTLLRRQRKVRPTKRGVAPSNENDEKNGAEKAFDWYDERLRRSPLLTKSLSNGFASGLGDVLAQTLTEPSLDWRRTLTWACLGWFYFGPVLHVWFGGLARMERHLVERHGTSKLSAVLTQVAFNQFCGSVIVNALFFYIFAFVNTVVYSVFDQSASFVLGAVLREGTAQLQSTLPMMMLLNWLFWPLPTILNLYVMPLRWRVLFSNSFSILWKCIISIITAARRSSGGVAA